MELTGLSHQTLINYEKRGKLSRGEAMRRDANRMLRRTVVYDPAQLIKIPRRQYLAQMPNADEQAARAFELFREGCSLDQVVIDTRANPDRIEVLHEKWLDQSKARYVITVQAQTALQDVVGEFEGMFDLIDQCKRNFISSVERRAFELLLSQDFSDPHELFRLVANKLGDNDADVWLMKAAMELRAEREASLSAGKEAKNMMPGTPLGTK